MDLRQLRHFLAVAQARSFTLAATRLEVSQPALSQSISRLERELDCTVFLRNKQNPGTGLLLTPAGTSLYTDAQAILDAVDRAASRARRAGHSLEKVRVAIGFASSTPRRLTHAALTVGEHVGGVEVLPVHLIWGDDHASLLSGRVDLAFMQYPVGASLPAYVVVGMDRSPRVALFPATHRLASRTAVSMDDLIDEPILDPGFGDDPQMYRGYWLGEPRPHRAGGLTIVGPPVRTVEEMCAFVAAGMGMAITSGLLAEQYGRPDLAFVPIEGLEPVEVGLARLREDERPHLLAVFNQLRTLSALA
jgi:DNA-binding transcriptional LysR family regulator